MLAAPEPAGPPAGRKVLAMFVCWCMMIPETVVHEIGVYCWSAKMGMALGLYPIIIP